jgi:hypothetical protein
MPDPTAGVPPPPAGEGEAEDAVPPAKNEPAPAPAEADAAKETPKPSAEPSDATLDVTPDAPSSEPSVAGAAPSAPSAHDASAEAPSGGPSPEEAPRKPSPLFLYLVIIPVSLLLLYGLVAAAVSGWYPKRAVPLRERMHADLESSDASAAALELGALSVGQPVDMVVRAFGLKEEAWERVPADEGAHFESPPLEAEEWRVTVNAKTKPLFLVIHGTVIEWREK